MPFRHIFFIAIIVTVIQAGFKFVAEQFTVTRSWANWL